MGRDKKRHSSTSSSSSSSIYFIQFLQKIRETHKSTGARPERAPPRALSGPQQKTDAHLGRCVASRALVDVAVSSDCSFRGGGGGEGGFF